VTHVRRAQGWSHMAEQGHALRCGPGEAPLQRPHTTPEASMHVNFYHILLGTVPC